MMYMEDSGEPYGTREYYKQEFEALLDKFGDRERRYRFVISALMRALEVATKHKCQSYEVWKLAERLLAETDD